MPGPDAAYGAGALYPKDEEEHRDLLTFATQAFTAADADRQPHVDRWTRHYKHYRSHVDLDPNDWRSKMFIPVSFWVVETILPRLVAQLPKFLVNPVGPEDEEPAKTMEDLLDYCADKSGLEVELIEGFKSSLMYGTGVLKVFYSNEPVPKIVREPILEDATEMVEQVVIDPDTGQPMLDINGDELVDQYPVTNQVETGEFRTVRQMVPPPYDGPRAENVDLANLWVAPGSTDFDDAPYVIQRHERDIEYLKAKIEAKDYALLGGRTIESLVGGSDEDPVAQRQAEVGMSAGDKKSDETRKLIELWEIWTRDGRVITVAARRAILRHDYNPFLHGEIPFVKIVDHPVPGEFYGVGEIESVEALQDSTNALVNLRIDNGKLALSPMAAGDLSKLKDPAQLVVKPGGFIDTSGHNPNEVIQWLERPDVPYSAFEEVAAIEAMIEKVTGVSAYQTGNDSPSLNDTATGVAIIQEQGATRFGMKTKLAEVTALRRLARQYGAIIQQFWTEEKPLRIVGPRGKTLWDTLDPESMAGSFDYDIEPASTVQTETVRQQMALSLLHELAPYFPPVTLPVTDALGQPVVDPMTGQPAMEQQEHPGLTALKEDVLEAFGKKDTGRYLSPEDEQPEGAVDDQGQPVDPMGGIPPELMAQMAQQSGQQMPQPAGY